MMCFTRFKFTILQLAWGPQIQDANPAPLQSSVQHAKSDTTKLLAPQIPAPVSFSSEISSISLVILFFHTECQDGCDYCDSAGVCYYCSAKYYPSKGPCARKVHFKIVLLISVIIRGIRKLHLKTRKVHLKMQKVAIFLLKRFLN